MRHSLIPTALLALGLTLSPQTAWAQMEDQPTTTPYGGQTANPATANPESANPESSNPMTSANPMGGTPPPGQTIVTTSSPGNGGYWGLIGLLGLFGLLGRRSRTTE